MSSEVASSWAPCSTSLMPAAATTSPRAATRLGDDQLVRAAGQVARALTTDARPAAAASAAAATTSIPATTRSVPSMASASAALRASAAVCLVAGLRRRLRGGLGGRLGRCLRRLGGRLGRGLRGGARRRLGRLPRSSSWPGACRWPPSSLAWMCPSLAPTETFGVARRAEFGRLAPVLPSPLPDKSDLLRHAVPCPLVGSCRLLLFGVRRDSGRGIVEPQPATPVEVANPRADGRRRVLSGVALVLACLTILLATVAVWVHQVAFNTDRFTGLVANVIDEPASSIRSAPRSASRSSRRSTSRPGSRAGCPTWRSRWRRPSRSPSRMGSPAGSRSGWPGRRSRRSCSRPCRSRTPGS